KQGDREALEILGFQNEVAVEVRPLPFEPAQVPRDGSVRLGLALSSTSHLPQELAVDLRVYFVKAGGKVSPKVFKLKEITLEPGQCRELGLKVSLAPMTTRVHYPGCHRVEALVNGHVFELGAFQ